MFNQKMPQNFYIEQVRQETKHLMESAEAEASLAHHLDYLRGMTAGFWISGVITTVHHVELFDFLTKTFNERCKVLRTKAAA